jgi:hypothetical protein
MSQEKTELHQMHERVVLELMSSSFDVTVWESYHVTS